MIKPAIYFTDLHCNKYTQFSENRDRLKDCLQVINDVFKFAAHYESNTILFGGDMIDLPKWVYISVVDSLIACLQKNFAKYPNSRMYAISGNHDQNQKNFYDKPAKSFLSVLVRSCPGRFFCIDNDVAIIGKKQVVMGVPYYEHKSCFDLALDKMHEAATIAKGDGNKVTLLIHQTPEGLPNKNIKAETNPADPRYDVFDMVLDGHIHTSQRITKKFLIGGNPLHRDLGDAGNEKGVWLLDLADPANTVEFLSRKGRYPEFKRMKAADITPEDTANNFIVPVMEEQSIILDGSAPATEFASSLTHEALLTNFWKATEGKDEKLLRVGLSLLQD